MILLLDSLRVNKSQLVHEIINNMAVAAQEQGISTNTTITGIASLVFLFLCMIISKLHIFQCSRNRTSKKSKVKDINEDSNEHCHKKIDRGDVKDCEKSPAFKDPNVDCNQKDLAAHMKTKNCKKETESINNTKIDHKYETGHKCTVTKFERVFSKVPASLILMIVACLVFYGMCPLQTSMADNPVSSIVAVGASLPQRMYNFEAEQYSCYANNTETMAKLHLDPINLIYNATGSASGRDQFLMGNIQQWISSDLYWTDDQQNNIRGKHFQSYGSHSKFWCTM